MAAMMVAACERAAPPQPPAEVREEPAAEQAPEGEEGTAATAPTGERAAEPPQSLIPKRPTEAPQDIPGVAFTEKLIEILDQELNGRFFGWRPNDLIIGKCTDNVNEFQLGVLEAVRYTTIKLKETLTRFGDADAYDPHLINAVNLLMNKADQFWFPSSESQYRSALEELKAFLDNLKQGRSRFFYRTDNLFSLVTAYKDLLGNCHENLVKEVEPDGSEVSFFKADNYFYYAKGVAHVMDGILGTVRKSFVEQLRTVDAVDLMDKIVEDLGRAVDCDPWIILNSGDGSILANHRYHLAAPISSALHNMNTMLRY
jgi:hypothetical protein